jgi:hypothetical protein
MQKMCNDEFREKLAGKSKDSLKNYTYHSFKTALDQVFAKNEN